MARDIQRRVFPPETRVVPAGRCEPWRKLPPSNPHFSLSRGVRVPSGARPLLLLFSLLQRLAERGGRLHRFGCISDVLMERIEMNGMKEGENLSSAIEENPNPINISSPWQLFSINCIVIRGTSAIGLGRESSRCSTDGPWGRCLGSCVGSREWVNQIDPSARVIICWSTR